ncbi:hypothetical protein MCUN1_002242 [Malassezia cuniculi]|uniref:PX domain-containing protein n=1 Tax=Malassezia cuniculi TaxID=948313 RepID=A0AAF0ER96_9BASI|nr:hypothetical protein MCUN1_002242 [Malassezia cuniculi]
MDPPSTSAIRVSPRSSQIVDARKTTEFSTTSYIVYDIRAGTLAAKRRYSEFEALRTALVALHPTLIVPPIPPKQPLLDYALKQGRVKNDPLIIAHRRRTLERFLQRVDTTPGLHDDPVFRRFLDARFSWHEIQSTPPLSQLPKSNLAAPPADPANPNVPASYAALPVPRTVKQLRAPNARFRDSEEFTRRFGVHMETVLERSNRKLTRRWQDLAADYAELGAVLNALSLDAGGAAAGLERTGQAADATYMAANDMLAQWTAEITEPIHEYTQYADILQQIIRWRHLKHQQLETVQELLSTKRMELAELERVEAEASRLSQALEQGGRGLVAPPPRSSVYAAAAEDGDESRGSIEATLPAVPQHTPRKGLIDSLRHSIQHAMDVDPAKTRQSNISRLREEVILLDDAMRRGSEDLQYVTDEIQASLNRFQRSKVYDMRAILIAYARIHRDYCVKSRDAWAQAGKTLAAIDSQAWGGMPDAALPPRANAGR